MPSTRQRRPARRASRQPAAIGAARPALRSTVPTYVRLSSSRPAPASPVPTRPRCQHSPAKDERVRPPATLHAARRTSEREPRVTAARNYITASAWVTGELGHRYPSLAPSCRVCGKPQLPGNTTLSAIERRCRRWTPGSVSARSRCPPGWKRWKPAVGRAPFCPQYHP